MVEFPFICLCLRNQHYSGMDFCMFWEYYRYSVEDAFYLIQNRWLISVRMLLTTVRRQQYYFCLQLNVSTLDISRALCSLRSQFLCNSHKHANLLNLFVVQLLHSHYHISDSPCVVECVRASLQVKDSFLELLKDCSTLKTRSVLSLVSDCSTTGYQHIHP